MADDRCKTEAACQWEPWCRINSRCHKAERPAVTVDALMAMVTNYGDKREEVATANWVACANNTSAAFLAIRADLERLVAQVPQGWQLVPKTPTEEMIEAACDCDAYRTIKAANKAIYEGLDVGASAGEVFALEYKTALEAAPPPPISVKETK